MNFKILINFIFLLFKNLFGIAISLKYLLMGILGNQFINLMGQMIFISCSPKNSFKMKFKKIFIILKKLNK
jgi:hypothetical protein